MNLFLNLLRSIRRAHMGGATAEPAGKEIHYIDAVPVGPGLLYPDMLPKNVWGSNLRGILSRNDWDRLRVPVCEAVGNLCEVCGQPGFDPVSGKPRRPDCHELWHFEVTANSAVQRLARLIALCPDCHRVQHSGRAAIRGELTMVISQLKAINSWSDAEIRMALDNAEQRYRWRSHFDWSLDLTLLIGQVRVDDHSNLLIPATARHKLGNSYFAD